MDSADLPEDLAAQIERIGAVEVAVGLVTGGPSPALPAVVASVRTGLESRLAGRPVALIHVDRAPSEETSAQVGQGWGDLPVIAVPGAHVLHAPDGEVAWSDAVHTVLRTGRAADARAILMLNADLAGTAPHWPASLAEPVLKDGCGLVLGVYQRNRYDGTLTQSLVIPLMRALFGRQLRQPLADEFACSADAANAFLADDVWTSDLGQHGLELWLPVAALAHDVAIGQAVVGRRAVPAPARAAPLGPTVGRVVGALFALAERFENLWLERRGSEPVRTFGTAPEPQAGGAAIDPERLQVGFRQGLRDLLPIWERILAPETLGDVLARSDGGPGEAAIGDRLWARIVYDFLLAYRARVMYRSHLVQSLAPLYLGRVAALVLDTRGGPPSAVLESGERLCRIFEEEKPYLADRWH